MIRRTYLVRSGVLVGGLTALAGCHGDELVVHDLVVQEALPFGFDVDQVGVRFPDKAQFLLCKVTGGSDVRLETESRTFERGSLWARGANYVMIDGSAVGKGDQDADPGWVLFDLPPIDTPSAALHTEAADHQLPPELVADLAQAPAFDVERIEWNDRCVDLTVVNTGDESGRFYASVRSSHGGYSSIEVPPGHTRSLQVCSYPGDAEGVRWDGGSKRFDTTPTRSDER